MPRGRPSNVFDAVSPSKSRGRSKSQSRGNSALIEPSRTGPDRPSDGKIVGFKAFIRNLNYIDTEKQRFFIDIWVCAYTSEVSSATEAFQNCYQDPRAEEFFDGSQRPPWTLTFVNAEEVKYVYLEKNLPTIRKFDDGSFFERQHVQCYISQSLDLRMFPFDRQVLEIKISLDVNVNIAKFQDDPKKLDISVDKGGEWKHILKQTEWFVSDDKPEISILDREVSSGELVETKENLTTIQGANRYSTVVIRIKVRRNWAYYVNGMIIPLGVIFLSAFFVFFHNGDKEGEKQSISEHMSYLSTLLLAIIAVRWSFSEKMPKVPYLCLMDQLFAVATLSVFLTMMVLVFAGQKRGLKWSIYLMIFSLILWVILFLWNRKGSYQEERKKSD